MTLEQADELADFMFGEAFCAISLDGTHEIFKGDVSNAILMGQGNTFEEALDQAAEFYVKFESPTA